MMRHNYKMPTTLLATFCALATVAHWYVLAADGSLASQLQALKVSPDIINIPSYVKTIKFELHGNIVKPGDPVPAKNFKDLDVDKISWDVSNMDARHTLLLVDLDRRPANSNASYSGASIYNQLTSLNIPGSLVDHGQTIVAYDPPVVSCQAPSSKHRLLMLACHQQQNIDISEAAYMSASSGQSNKREGFKLNEFLNRHRLDVIAANVFLAIGDTSGVCSGSATIHSPLASGSLTTILLAMVTMALTFGYYNTMSKVN